MTRYGMALDMDHCIGCQTCVVSCQMNNALRPGTSRNSVDKLEAGRWPEGDLAFLPHACLHCDEPLCASVCPTGASFKREDGIVVVDHALCIGCGVCITSCEYGARSIDTHDGYYFGADTPAAYEIAGRQQTGTADKCTFCYERIDQGLQPACVQDCVAGVRVFGDLDDPTSGINAFLSEHRCESVPGTSVYYNCGKRDLDLKSVIVARYYTSSKTDREQQHTDEPTVNPTVIAAAGAATVAVATGLGVTARRSRARRAEAEAERPADTTKGN